MSSSTRKASNRPGDLPIEARSRLIPAATKKIGMDETRRREQPDNPQRQRQADEPSDDREPAGRGPQGAEVELIPREQEQEPQPQVDEGRDAERLSPAQDVRADDHAADKEDHYLWQVEPGEHADDDRGSRRDQGDGQQGAEAGVRRHQGTSAVSRNAGPRDLPVGRRVMCGQDGLHSQS